MQYEMVYKAANERDPTPQPNQSEVCQGKWTWCGRGSKSATDFVLIDTANQVQVTEMTIDETGERWGIGSDHKWIKTKIIIIIIINNYRGITVSSCGGKVLTMVLAARLKETAETQQRLPEAQAASWKKQCVEDHLFVVRALAHRAKIKKKHLYCTFLDLKKAYDSVDRESLWNKLESIGLDNQSTDFLRNLYRNKVKRIESETM